ncbi:MAG: hypothetical protein M3Z66_17975, partial [Chloroflexota bacterium]|nr:hypothetical protein [Chloroflexota bacterium]
SASPTGPVRPWRRPLLLHLTVPGIQLTERYDQPAPRGRPCEKYSRVGRAGGHRWRDVTVSGPFAFALTVPVTNDLRVAFLRQTARMGRVRMTLERVELTPSDARVYWRDNLGRTGVGLSAELGGPPILQPFPGIPPVRRHGEVFVRGLYMGAHHGLRVYTFDVPGYDFHGQWTLLIYNDAGDSRGGEPASGKYLSLHFKVP